MSLPIILFSSFLQIVPSLLVVRFLDVGYGDAIVLSLPEGATVLVDGGGPEYGPKLAATLRDMGVKQLKYLVISHFHKDHAGGLYPIVNEFLPIDSQTESNRLERILISLLPKVVEPEVEAVRTEIERRPYRTVNRGETIWVSPSVRLEVLHPMTLRGDPNEDSLVLRVIHNRVTFLFAGDIGLNAQKELLQEYGSRLSANILKVPHHAGEALEAFIQAIHPQAAIVSVGPNPYGFPNPEVLRIYQKVGAHIHRTDEDGSITVTSDGRSFKVHTERSP